MPTQQISEESYRRLAKMADDIGFVAIYKSKPAGSFAQSAGFTPDIREFLKAVENANISIDDFARLYIAEKTRREI